MSINTRGIPSRVCLSCGEDTFKILVRFDDDASIAWHTTNGYCATCKAPITVPVPEYAGYGQGELEFDEDFDSE